VDAEATRAGCGVVSTSADRADLAADAFLLSSDNDRMPANSAESRLTRLMGDLP
jgi:hypothetical protein